MELQELTETELVEINGGGTIHPGSGTVPPPPPPAF